MGPNSFQWCPATGQGAMGTKWRIGSSTWTWGRTSLLWGWQSPGIGCPGRLWSLLLWSYSRPTWTCFFAACCRWPCFGRRVGLDDPQRSVPDPAILWFCNSVINKLCVEWGELLCTQSEELPRANKSFLEDKWLPIDIQTPVYYILIHSLDTETWSLNKLRTDNYGLIMSN